MTATDYQSGRLHAGSGIDQNQVLIWRQAETNVSEVALPFAAKGDLASALPISLALAA